MDDVRVGRIYVNKEAERVQRDNGPINYKILHWFPFIRDQNCPTGTMLGRLSLEKFLRSC